MSLQDTAEFHVKIVLCTLNGEEFLLEQLRSLLDQDHKNWSLLISDDGSTDQTLKILSDFARGNPTRKIKVIDGPRRGFAKNFLFALREAEDADFYAFCDQDDVWLPWRLTQGISALASSQAYPAIAGGRTQYVDREGKILGKSPRFARAPSFQNALVQSLFGGNSMTINKAMRDLLVRTIPPSAVISHDWWCYLVCEGVGGRTIYLDKPAVLYRQHAANLVGSNSGLLAVRHRISRALRGGFREWTDANVQALLSAKVELETQKIVMLEQFACKRGQNFLTRLVSAMTFKYYRQTILGNISLRVLFVLRLI